MSSDNLSDGPNAKQNTAATSTGVENQRDDESLAKLLDDALKDFEVVAPGDVPCPASSEPEEAPALADSFFENPENLKKAASQFKQMLDMVQDMSKNAPEDDVPSGESGSEDKMVFDFLKSIQCMSEHVDKIATAGNDGGDLKSAMDELFSSDEMKENIAPFMQGAIDTILSKEMLYPSLMELKRKYPDWLSENRDSLTESDRTRYEKQIEIVGKLCQEYESIPDADTPGPSSTTSAPDDPSTLTPGSTKNSSSAATKTASDVSDPGPALPRALEQSKMEKIVFLLQEMQTFGDPPPELMDLAPGFALQGETGQPRLQDPAAVAEQCTVM